MESAMLQRSIHVVLTACLVACATASTACSTCPSLQVDDPATSAQLELRHSQDFLANVADAGTLIFTDSGVARVHGGEGVGCGDSADAIPTPCIVAVDQVRASIAVAQASDGGTARIGIDLAKSDTIDINIGTSVTLDVPTKPGRYALADLGATLCETACGPVDGSIDIQDIAVPCDSGACGRLDADVTFDPPASPASNVASLAGTAHLHYAESIVQTYACGGGGGGDFLY
jgi:hypothetical protein